MAVDLEALRFLPLVAGFVNCGGGEGGLGIARLGFPWGFGIL